MANQENNKWSDKLNQLPTPDETESWNRMEALLNTHLPKQKSTWRYAGIALLLLLLVIGICNYPRLTNNYSADNIKDVEKQVGSGKKDLKSTSTTNANESIGHIDKQDLEIRKPENKGKQTKSSFDQIHVDKQPSNSSSNHIPTAGTRRNSIDARAERNLYTNARIPNRKINPSPATGFKDPQEQKLNTRTAVSDIGNASSSNQPTFSKTNSSDKVDSSSTAFTIDSTINDSSKTKTSLAKKQAKQKKTKLSFGTGLNYFFALNGQERSTVNAKGYNNSWSNFFPVLMGRYYLKEGLYLQAELQLSAPQYTNKILIDKKISQVPGPSPAANKRIESSIFTNRLFYADVPLSLNASLTKNLFFGAGLQYSHLRKAIGLYEDKMVATGRPDSIISIQTKPIDENLATANFKKNEWRYNLNATVKINRFDVGVRYTRSLQPFTIKILPGYSKSEMTNSSLSLFLRYELIRLGAK